jgi:hypothetical protein
MLSVANKLIVLNVSILSVVMLIDVILNVVMPNDVILNVVMPSVGAPKAQLLMLCFGRSKLNFLTSVIPGTCGQCYETFYGLLIKSWCVCPWQALPSLV